MCFFTVLDIPKLNYLKGDSPILTISTTGLTPEKLPSKAAKEQIITG